VLDRGVAGDRLDLEIALAPCMIGYAEIAAERIARSGHPPRRQSVSRLAPEYSSDEYQSLRGECGAALDEQFARRAARAAASARRNFHGGCSARTILADGLAAAR